MVVDTRVDERTLRELYLPAFERAVTESQVDPNPNPNPQPEP